MAFVKIDLAKRGRELGKKFENSTRNITTLFEKELEVAAEKVRDDAKRLAPVDSGQLRNSIGIRQEGTKQDIVFHIGSMLEYAAIQEYGGYTGKGHKSYISPQPYLRPALIRNERFIYQQLQKALDNWGKSL